MALRIEKHKDGKQYRIYSTVSDSFITPFVNKETIKGFHKKALLESLEDDYKRFPKGWIGTDGNLIK